MKLPLYKLASAGLVASALSLSAAATPIELQNLQNLGSVDFVLSPFYPSNFFKQVDNQLIFEGGVRLGDTLAGSFGAPQSWSAYSSFGLRMTLLSGLNPLLPFTVSFFDKDSQSVDFVSTTTSLLNANQPTLVPLGYASGDRIVLSSIIGMQFTWDGDANSLNIAVSDVVALAPPDEGFFTARAPGGFIFMTDAGVEAKLPAGESSWAIPSDRHAKTDVAEVDARKILQQVAELPVTAWRYKHNPERPYIGPMAQDFHETFGLGSDDRHISTLDTDGVTLAALQGLIVELRERQDRSAAQARRLAELEAELHTLSEEVRSKLPLAE